MLHKKIQPVIKRALYFGEMNSHVRRLKTYLNSCADGESVWRLETYEDRSTFNASVKEGQHHLVLLDVTDVCGLNQDLVKYVKAFASGSGVIILSRGNLQDIAPLILSGDVDDIVGLMQDPAQIMSIMTAYLQRQVLASEAQRAEHAGLARTPLWAGKTMAQVASRIPNIMKSAVTCVHISGETGTGKEIVARIFRDAMGSVPFVPVNCAAISESLMEALLFGSVKGAFTGSTRDQKGFFEEAHGGWIFLDEVGCLSKPAQAALLRAIENQEIIRVGDTATKKLNFRVLAATNAPLREMARTGAFRLDLFQRLAEVEICLPPLRERRDELTDIIQCLVDGLAGGPYRLSDAAHRLLEIHPWREGNIRELRNCLRAMTEFALGGILTPQGIPRNILEEACKAARTKNSSKMGHQIANQEDQSFMRDESSTGEPSIRLVIPQAERIDFDRLTLELFSLVAKAITEKKGKCSTRQLAALLGMSKSTISRKINAAIERGIGELEMFLGLD